MDLTRATSALAGTRFSRITWVGETGSTNADLLDAARRGEGEQVLGAEFQTAGRGRLGRDWSAGAGASILCSVLVRPAPETSSPHLATAAVGLAAAEAIEHVVGWRVGIKWPNDLVAAAASTGTHDDRKLSGILAEAVVVDGRVDAVVVGIGINVNWPEMPAELSDTATALNHLAGHDVDRTDVVIELIRRTAMHLDAAAGPDGRVGLRDAVSARSATLGRRVRIEQPNGLLEGTAVALGPDGELVVETATGPVTVSVGDVVHLRPI